MHPRQEHGGKAVPSADEDGVHFVRLPGDVLRHRGAVRGPCPLAPQRHQVVSAPQGQQVGAGDDHHVGPMEYNLSITSKTSSWLWIFLLVSNSASNWLRVMMSVTGTTFSL